MLSGHLKAPDKRAYRVKKEKRRRRRPAFIVSELGRLKPVLYPKQIFEALEAGAKIARQGSSLERR